MPCSELRRLSALGRRPCLREGRISGSGDVVRLELSWIVRPSQDSCKERSYGVGGKSAAQPATRIERARPLWPHLWWNRARGGRVASRLWKADRLELRTRSRGPCCWRARGSTEVVKNTIGGGRRSPASAVSAAGRWRPLRARFERIDPIVAEARKIAPESTGRSATDGVAGPDRRLVDRAAR